MLGPHWPSVWKICYLLFWCVSNLFKVLSGSTYVKLPRLSPQWVLICSQLPAHHLLMSPGSETTGYLEECFRAEKDNYYLLFFNVSENFMFSHGCLPWCQVPQLQVSLPGWFSLSPFCSTSWETALPTCMRATWRENFPFFPTFHSYKLPWMTLFIFPAALGESRWKVIDDKLLWWG